MTAPLDKIDPIARRLTDAVSNMIRAEVEQLRIAAPKAHVINADEEIMVACRDVAKASDRLEQVRHTRDEHRALTALERAAANLAKVMVKLGRFTGAAR